MLVEPSPAATSGTLHAQQRGGLAAQPLPHRPGRSRTRLALAEQLGSVNAAAAELGTTWPSLRKAFTRHGLGMPARNPHQSNSTWAAVGDTATLVTAVVLSLMAGVVRPVWVVPAWNSRDRSDSEEGRVTQ
jgi:hypothetical protein